MSVKALKEYVLAHYEDGGHWVYETHGTGDYELVLSSCGSVEAAKADLKAYWESMNAREQECRYE